MFAASKSGRAVSAATTDPYFPYVPLLLETTSTNGQQNNTFLDSSTNNFTITRNGTPTQGSVTPYWPTGYWSSYWNGTTQYISVGGTTSLSANFTIEFWFFPPSNAYSYFFGIDDTQNPNSLACIYNATAPSFEVFNDAGTPLGGGSLVLNSWNHVALVRNSSTVTLYVNGVQKATGSIPNSISGSLQIGRWLDSGSYSNGVTGYLSNFRVSNTNVYSGSTFTVPTSPLTVTANTVLLTLQDNRFKDNSASPKTLTVSGSPSIKSFQPFSPTASYTAAAYGGSGYFNGSSDYLTSATTAALDLTSGDWTIQGWYYPTAYSASNNVIVYIGSAAGNKIVLATIGTAGNLYYLLNGSVTISSATAAPLNAWSFYALVKSGATTTLYLNGVSLGTTASVPTTSNKSLSLGADTAAAFYQGYFGDFRVLKGTASTTVPTTPLTAITNTSLLLNFTNAGIYDAAVQNNAITVGSAQSSITQYKWSPTSMRFNGTSDYLAVPSNATFAFGTGNFTVEGWFYQTADNTYPSAFEIGPHVNSNAILFITKYSGNATIYSGAFYGTAATALNTWNYIAWVRSSGSLRIYVNGVGNTAVAFTNNLTDTSVIAVGRSTSAGTSGYYYPGYIQDLRVTKGVARYSGATITVPTAAFPTR